MHLIFVAILFAIRICRTCCIAQESIYKSTFGSSNQKFSPKANGLNLRLDLRSELYRSCFSMVYDSAQLTVASILTIQHKQATNKLYLAIVFRL